MKPTTQNSPQNAPLQRSGMLVLGHGTRSAAGVAEVIETAQVAAKALPETAAAVAFLEYAQPEIQTAIDQLAANQVSDIIVVPLFLFAADHMKEDIPAGLNQALRDFPGMRAHLLPPLAELPVIEQLSAERFRNALARTQLPASDVALLLVGRGGQDPAAIDDFCRFAARSAGRTFDQHRPGRLIPALLAGDQLPLEHAVTEATRAPFQAVVVQPHLLFPGKLMNRLKKLVEEQDAPGARQQWVLADPLGQNAALAAVVVEQFRLGNQRILRNGVSQKQNGQDKQRIYPLAS